MAITLAAGLKSPKILLVIDMPKLTGFIVAALAERGLDVVTGRSAEAHQILVGHPRHDAVIIAIGTADPVSSWNLAREARRMQPGIAVVYLSAGAPLDWARQCVAGSELISLPFAPPQLIAALTRQLDMPPPPARDGGPDSWSALLL